MVALSARLRETLDALDTVVARAGTTEAVAAGRAPATDRPSASGGIATDKAGDADPGDPVTPAEPPR